MTPGSRPTYLFLVLFLGVLFFVNLGSYGLLEDNEARFFEISWEMEKSGDLLTPRLNFINHFHKPPATFWLVGLSLKWFGETEAAGRLPVVLAALATVALSVLFLPPGEGRLFTGLLLSCNLEFWLLSRTVLTDMFLTLSVTACLLAAFQLLSQRESWAFWLFWLSLGFSALVKGPVGPAIVALTLLSFHVTSQKLPWRRWAPAKGLLVFAGVTVPWYLLVFSKHPGLLEYLADYQTVQRVASTAHGREGPLWFFLPVLLVGFLPWSPLLPSSIVSAWKRRHGLDRFLLCWLIPSFLLFSLSGSKLPTYILPLFPALALLVASNLGERDFIRSAAKSVAFVLLILGFGSLGFVQAGLPSDLVSAKTVIILGALVCLAGSVISFAFLRLKKPAPALVSCGIFFGTFLITLSYGLKLSEDAYSARHLAQTIQANSNVHTVVAEYADHLHSLPYYLKRRVIQVSYPRETQFEENGAVDGFLYPTLEGFLSHQPEEVQILMVLRPSDYKEQLFPEWQMIYQGRWLVLERRPLRKERKESEDSTKDHEAVDS